MEKERGTLPYLWAAMEGGGSVRGNAAGQQGGGRRTADGGRRLELPWRLGRGRKERASGTMEFARVNALPCPVYVPCLAGGHISQIE
jgi:hypothetical protein